MFLEDFQFYVSTDVAMAMDLSKGAQNDFLKKILRPSPQSYRCSKKPSSIGVKECLFN